MKITLCGSIAFYDEMLEVQKELELNGHEVKLPPHEVADYNGDMIPVKDYYELRKAAKDDEGWIWDRKEEAIRWHLDKVVWADGVLILNYDKNDISGYVGANTLIEMGLAFYQKKTIFLLNEIPEMTYKEKILAMKPILLGGDLSKVQVPTYNFA